MATTTVNVLATSTVSIDVAASTYIMLIPPTGGSGGGVSLNGANATDGQIVTVACSVSALSSPSNKIYVAVNSSPFLPNSVRFGPAADDNKAVMFVCDKTGLILGNSAPGFYPISYVAP